MVCNLKMFTLKFKNFDYRENFRRYVIILAAIVFVVMYGIAGLAWTIILYLLISYFTRNREA
jgi:CDP-diacylglycerol--serine O-phosphatidyltransferase